MGRLIFPRATLIYQYKICLHVLILYHVVVAAAASDDDDGISGGSKSLVFGIIDEISKDNFTYYDIITGGELLVVLKTLEGDADMYLSQSNAAPSFDPTTYDLHSATCGLDSINVPPNFARPITVGVFGHSAYDLTRFTLEVYQIAQPQLDNEERDHALGISSDKAHDNNDDDKESMRRIISTVRLGGIKRNNKWKRKKLSNAIWPFIELFEVIFF